MTDQELLQKLIEEKRNGQDAATQAVDKMFQTAPMPNKYDAEVMAAIDQIYAPPKPINLQGIGLHTNVTQDQQALQELVDDMNKRNAFMEKLRGDGSVDLPRVTNPEPIKLKSKWE